MSMKITLSLLLLLACGDNVSPSLDASSPEPSCAALGCTIPACEADVCSCMGVTCVPTGIPIPTSCDELQCRSLSCGMGDEEGRCTCTHADGSFETCLASAP